LGQNWYGYNNDVSVREIKNYTSATLTCASFGDVFYMVLMFLSA
jgi:hypothetical protein